MEAVVINKEIAEALSLFNGQTPEAKIINTIIEALEHRLAQCHQKLGFFEAKYGMPFDGFARAWDKDEIADKHGYETESDYIDWEAYEMERQNILRVLARIKARE
ncbi:hypothetical protein [Moorella sp. Hama-1]|uniref:hypothetical protein n=1 Tax=Moorella sp. Hama-1 TaxID=2138101 RepID=UPI000D64D2E9|nr:hypothetical protein [Moorella sp. Hama-1]MDN5362106.1 hypothetical protein [Moorella sp. (in: firmicutes)]BCV19955.1 hypothetical protein hamaS1_00240 [Moorella sp. Hama-1]